MYPNYGAPQHHPNAGGYPPQQPPTAYPPAPGYPYAAPGQHAPTNASGYPAPGGYPPTGAPCYPNNGAPQYSQPVMNPHYPPPAGYPGQGFNTSGPYPGGVNTQYQNNAICHNPGVNPYFSHGSGPPEYLMPYQQRPSIKEEPFDPAADAAVLRKAMKGLGTDESAIINLISKRTDPQRQQIVSSYISTFGRDLHKDLKSELSGRFEDLVLALMTPRADFLAKKLNKAMVGAGTREKTLIDILCMADNSEIREINTSYQRLFGKSLVSDIKGDTSGYFEKLLVTLTMAGRSEDPRPDQAAAEADAQALNKAGEKRMGTDEETFNRILATRSFPQLRLICDAYQRMSRNALESAIKSEFSGNIKNALLAILRCARNRAGYFAMRLNDSTARLGTHDDDLIFIVVSRADIDMENIKEEYKKLYQKPLEKDISGDTSGDYKKMLLAIVGALKLVLFVL